MKMEEHIPVIGVLALQGAVEEHIQCLQRCGCRTKEIKYAHEMEELDGIILPGGESTTMAIVGENCGLFPAIKQFVEAKKPVWGTCAGMILLSDHAIKQKEGGQSLIGGLDVQVCRNYFGSQIHSCEINVPLKDDISTTESDSNKTNNNDDMFKAIFIRAPAILKTGPDVRVIATLRAKPHSSAVAEVSKVLNLSTDGQIPEVEVVVAVQQENILATAFHPELTNDLRWHKMFVEMVKNSKKNK